MEGPQAGHPVPTTCEAAELLSAALLFPNGDHDALSLGYRVSCNKPQFYCFPDAVGHTKCTSDSLFLPNAEACIALLSQRR